MATRIPINKDSYNFEERQKKIWEDMERDMERRRREWEEEIDKMRKEFFHLHPQNSEFGLDRPSSRLTANSTPYLTEKEDGKPLIEKDDQGNPVFKVQFNMKGYKPEEVNVKMDSTKIMVCAKHEEKGSGSTVSREYNREVNIPCDVNPLSLQCSLNPDGALVIHAPIPAPTYNAVKDSSALCSTPPGRLLGHQTSSSTPPGRSISHQTSSSLPVCDPITSFQQSSSLQHQQHTAPISKPSYSASSSIKPYYTTSSVFEENSSHPDHIVPSFKPPPDLSRLDKLDSPPPRISSHLNTLPSSNLQSSIFSRSSPFSTISSSFPSGSVFPEPASQVQLSTPIVTSHDGNFQLTLAINEFKPEELTVKTQDGKILICARREVMTGNRAQTIEMTREHSLPDNVDPLTVKAFFTETNNLIIEAPFLKG
ncbi:serpin B3 [Biomphalaria pfeifferi]|uniref:Serpin B3 n=1 Tax=Biomphalaria pfeifferi TaxID=112525 RepID=A0AAD8C8I4_BIOPF|nr:serpin B3 [Biomphalaria pfeifferi]